MRHAIAVLMIMVLGSLTSLPLLSATGDSLRTLPACCRVNGKHHCMMTATPGGTRQVAVSSTQRCPFYPQWRAVHAAPNVAGPVKTSNVLYAALRGHPACHAQTEALGRMSFDRSRQKRGPPSDKL